MASASEVCLNDQVRAVHAIPTVGRIVHYVGAGRRCLAAIVTSVHPDTGGPELYVLDSYGPFFKDGVIHDEEQRPGTYHWPERT